MIIDGHSHIGPIIEDPRLRIIADSNAICDAEHYIKAMDKAGINMGVTFCTLGLDVEYQAKIQKEYPDRIISIPWINPRTPDAPKLFRHCIEDLELKGLKLHGIWHQTSYSNSILLDPLIEICNKYHLPVYLHTEGGSALTTPLHAEELAKRWPNVNFIMCHGGHWWCANEAILVAKRTPNLYLDTPGADTIAIITWIEEVGADRVLMGSDFPFNDLNVLVESIKIIVPSLEDREWVMGKTVTKLLGLKIN